jgi:kynurenine formamidase
VRDGRIYRLARERFPKMPLFAGHPSFEVLSYRTPQGIRAAGDHPWGEPNDACLGYMSELVMGTTHTGAHIDAHAHMTVGEEDRWHGGSARTDLGDFGPLVGDATEIPPLWRRGVLYDVPGHRGVTALGAGEPIGADELLAIEAATGVAAAAGDVALVRTGYLSAWPDPERLAAHRGAGPDLSAARLLVDRGVVATGSDTETYEVQPAPDRGEPANPQPVHTLLLIERGVYILESLDLETLAQAGVREFLFVALPLAIRGATGSMVDPVAVT